MIWYNNIDAVNAIRSGIAEEMKSSRRGLRLVKVAGHATR